MTGVLQNADVVALACYAPLFVNTPDRTWNPDLIQFNSSAVAAIPSYYIQQLFSLNRGDTVLYANATSGNNLAVAATYDSRTGILNLIVVNYGAQQQVYSPSFSTLPSPYVLEQTASVNLYNVATVSPSGTMTVVTSEYPTDSNTLDNPNNVVPSSSAFSVFSTSFMYTFPAYSVNFVQTAISIY